MREKIILMKGVISMLEICKKADDIGFHRILSYQLKNGKILYRLSINMLRDFAILLFIYEEHCQNRK